MASNTGIKNGIDTEKDIVNFVVIRTTISNREDDGMVDVFSAKAAN